MIVASHCWQLTSLLQLTRTLTWSVWAISGPANQSIDRRFVFVYLIVVPANPSIVEVLPIGFFQLPTLIRQFETLCNSLQGQPARPIKFFCSTKTDLVEFQIIGKAFQLFANRFPISISESRRVLKVALEFQRESRMASSACRRQFDLKGNSTNLC